MVSNGNKRKCLLDLKATCKVWQSLFENLIVAVAIAVHGLQALLCTQEEAVALGAPMLGVLIRLAQTAAQPGYSC